MTSQSRKKRRTIAQMLTKGMLLSSAGLLSFVATLPDVQAQQALASQQATSQIHNTSSLHPVPRHGTTRVNLTTQRNSLNQTGIGAASSATSTVGLQWRTSSQIALKPIGNGPGTSDPFETPQPVDPTEHLATDTTLQVAAQSPQFSNIRVQGISQAAWLGTPSGPDQLTTPDTTQSDLSSAGGITLSAPIRIQREALAPPTTNNAASDDLFTPPSVRELSSDASAERRIALPATKNSTANRENDSPVHSLSLPSKRLASPTPAPQVAQVPTLPVPISEPAAQAPPTQQLSLSAPTQQSLNRAENPFPNNPADENQRVDDGLRTRLADDQNMLESTRQYGSGTDYLSQANFSCEEFRDRIAAQTIDQISLDISPPFRPDEFDQRRHDELFADFIEQQPIRKWSSIDGSLLTEGRLIDLAYEKAIIEMENGEQQYIPMSELSEGDLAHLNTTWGLPRECRIEQVAYQPRQWAPSKVTWTASNLCHNPLYFESVNLERYGHTRGPLLEPVVQSAHFFGNILILPYKMGVHGPRECQYALGYYRPGNEAPWIKQPLPISARGALAQAATMSGLFWLIP